MKPFLRTVVLALICLSSAHARQRTIVLTVPLPQGKFPPPWTHSIRVSITDAEALVQDHRLFKKGQSQFKAVLSGNLYNQEYTIEFLCLGKGEKPVAVFQRRVHIHKGIKKLELRGLQFVQLIRD